MSNSSPCIASLKTLVGDVLLPDLAPTVLAYDGRHGATVECEVKADGYYTDYPARIVATFSYPCQEPLCTVKRQVTMHIDSPTHGKPSVTMRPSATWRNNEWTTMNSIGDDRWGGSLDTASHAGGRHFRIYDRLGKLIVCGSADQVFVDEWLATREFVD